MVDLESAGTEQLAAPEVDLNLLFPQFVELERVKIGTSGLRDALAVALAQRVAEQGHRSYRCTTVAECAAVERENIDYFVQRGATERQKLNLQLILEEALMNALKHGVLEQENPDGFLTVVWGERDGMIEFFVEDTGPGFDPTRIPNPVHPDNLGANHGRGVLLLDKMNLPHLQGEVTYLPSNGGATCNKLHVLVPIKLSSADN